MHKHIHRRVRGVIKQKEKEDSHLLDLRTNPRTTNDGSISLNTCALSRMSTERRSYPRRTYRKVDAERKVVESFETTLTHTRSYFETTPDETTLEATSKLLRNYPERTSRCVLSSVSSGAKERRASSCDRKGRGDSLKTLKAQVGVRIRQRVVPRSREVRLRAWCDPCASICPRLQTKPKQ